jgi:hypothetical protein
MKPTESIKRIALPGISAIAMAVFFTTCHSDTNAPNTESNTEPHKTPTTTTNTTQKNQSTVVIASNEAPQIKSGGQPVLKTAIQLQYKVINKSALKIQLPEPAAYNWKQQTQSALQAAAKGANGEQQIIDYALQVYEKGFDGWIEVSPSLPANAKPQFQDRKDLFVPQLLSVYSMEALVFEQMEDGQTIPRSVSVQLPMNHTTTLLSLTQWQTQKNAAAATLAEELNTKPKACGDDSGLHSSFWSNVEDSNKAESTTFPGLVIANVGCVMDWEGGGAYPVEATQLLLYNKTGQLALVAGFGQVSILQWTGTKPASINRAQVFNGFTADSVVLEAQ